MAENEVFMYMGQGTEVPDDVVRVRVHPSVKVIPEDSFRKREMLEEIELCEGLIEIENWAFLLCKSLKQVVIPSTVRRIGYWTFNNLSSMQLPDELEYLGHNSLHSCTFSSFRLPPLVTTIPSGILKECTFMVSMELSENVRQCDAGPFESCWHLRNIAIPSDAVLEERIDDDRGNTFNRCKDLHELFDSEAEIRNALKHRFDGLPIHKMIYYQSYNTLTSNQLNNATNMRSDMPIDSEVDPTGKQQDCLGMTPLHILACSTVQRIELYKVLIKKYPENLVIKDRWGALPIFYALWTEAPDEIVQFLVESYQSIYPNHVFNWSDMVEVLGISTNNAFMNVIKKLLDVQQTYFPEQCINWETILTRLAELNWNHPRVYPSSGAYPYPCEATFRFMVKCGTARRVDAIGLKKLRRKIETDIETFRCTHPKSRICFDRFTFLTTIQVKLAEYEAEYSKLKAATTMIELVLWKNEMEDHNQTDKRLKVDMSGWRNQCRVRCGADVVIGHVLPYLLS